MLKSFKKLKRKYNDEEILGILRRHLDTDKFHLNVTMGAKDWSNGPYVDSWSLFYNYRFNTDYFNKKNGPVLNSEENSLEELYDFVKLHEKKDLLMVYFKCNTTCLFLLLALVFIDIFVVENEIVSAICLGYSFGSLVSYLVYLLLHKAISYNNGVDYIYLLETSLENHKNAVTAWDDLDKKEKKAANVTEKDISLMESKLIDKKPYDAPKPKAVKATVKIGESKEYEVANAVGKKIPVAIVTGVNENEKGNLEVTCVQTTLDGTKIAKIDSKAEKKPVEKKKVSAKPNVSKTTNTAKKAVKMAKSDESNKEIEKMTEGLKNCGETFEKLGTNVEPTPKKKPGRPKKVNDEKVS